MAKNLVNIIKQEKIIAIVRGVQNKDIFPVVTALVKGGIFLIEVTFNQKNKDSWKDTANAISLINKNFDGVVVGAGTVFNKEQLLLAKNSGAEFILSPHTDLELISQTKKEKLVSIPGAITPSECASAFNAGADFIKLFPAGNFGASYLKAITSPLSHIPFLCVGGVNFDNIPVLLKNGASGIGIGGNLVDLNLIEQADFDKIKNLAAKYVNVVKNYTTGG